MTSATRVLVVANRTIWRSGTVRVVLAFIGLLAIAIYAAPIGWMALASLRPSSAIATGELNPLAGPFTWDGYWALLEFGFARNVMNSLITATAATLASTGVAVLAAYGFARMKFPGRSALLGSVMGFQLFPFVMVVVPLFGVFVRLNLVDSYLGLIVSYVAITQPLAVYMLYNQFNSIPRELDDAAAIDGAGRFRALRSVLLPIAAPTVAVVLVFSFSVAWDEYLVASVLSTSRTTHTLPVALASLFGQFGTRYEVVMAAATIGSLPTIVLFLALQRQIVTKLGGTVKG